MGGERGAPRKHPARSGTDGRAVPVDPMSRLSGAMGSRSQVRKGRNQVSMERRIRKEEGDTEYGDSLRLRLMKHVGLGQGEVSPLRVSHA